MGRSVGRKSPGSMRRGRKITAVSPQKRDEIAARQWCSQTGGRPPAFDETRYKQRNLV
jgi:hypothetical protein